jgi:uncharacterized protein
MAEGPPTRAATRRRGRQAGDTSFDPPVLNLSRRVAEPSLPWLAQLEGPRSGDLPDINVWLALAVQEHPHHQAALRYWAEVQAEIGRQGADTYGGGAGSRLWFCRVTMLGLVRLLCQPKAVGPGALDTIAAWTLYTQYRALPHIGLLPDPEGCDDTLRALVGAGSLPPRLWTDAYLAALSVSAGLRLVTFDRDFERFGLERCLILEG